MENKTYKYVKYALGEIILVVIGILIALQINNWNENKKSVRMAETYILDIRQDLINDTIMFNAALKRINQTIETNKSILSIKETGSISKDSLFSILNTFHSMRIYQITNNTYLKLLNTGFLESNLYGNLFSSINDYYTKEYKTYSEYIEWDKEQSIDIFHSDFLGDYKDKLDITSLYRFSKNQEKENDQSMNLNNIRAFIMSNQFRNKTGANYTRKIAVADRILTQKKLASKLLSEINKQLSIND
jgi:hypothetical protein